MADELVKARWNGPFDAQVGPGVVLKQGDEYEVTPGDLLSSHWVPVGREAKALEKEGLEAAQEQVEQVNTDPEPPPSLAEDQS